MAARVGVARAAVLDAATAVLLDDGRLANVGLRPVADRLGVRIQSLYAHIEGVAELRRCLALRALDDLARALAESAIGRSGSDAVASIVRAYITFALEHP